ncbi:hypothetical protein TW81_02250 [Vibrio galatheae]|uniref:Uncharacterized protein n=1 Tax=Vibrio galatheae TaxID=579748 RepID=A0A0F4NRW6_9VIBR|nr:hypothetical protein [Vibrio galatheae]KJY84836.1 hypothetical protein TW81_02250 [Vibrio galatheae]
MGYTPRETTDRGSMSREANQSRRDEREARERNERNRERREEEARRKAAAQAEQQQERERQERVQREAYQAEARTIEAPPEEAPTFVDNTLSAIRTATLGISEEEAKQEYKRYIQHMKNDPDFQGERFENQFGQSFANHAMNTKVGSFIDAMADMIPNPIAKAGAQLGGGLLSSSQSYDTNPDIQSIANDIADARQMANFGDLAGFINPAFGAVAGGIVDHFNAERVANISPHAREAYDALQASNNMPTFSDRGNRDRNQSQGLLAPSGPTLYYDNPVAFEQQQGNHNWSSDWLEQRRRLMGMS